MLYCITGWFINAFIRSDAKGHFRDYIPHKQFWSLLPQYVNAGCTVTKRYVSDKTEGAASQGAVSDTDYRRLVDGTADDL